MIGFREALRHVDRLQPLGEEKFGLEQALGLICSRDVVARSDCPSLDASLKDGLAVRSSDVEQAGQDNPVPLRVLGTITAGEDSTAVRVEKGGAVRIMTGAPVPTGATAVLAAEFVRSSGKEALALADAQPGRNILRRGSDVTRGQVVVRSGERLTPTHLGLLAAAGCGRVACYRPPATAVVATGSELVLPGEPIRPGRVAASNLVTVAAELHNMGIRPQPLLIRDDLEQLQDRLAAIVREVDVLITCGGVLDGDKDLTMRAMDRLGMERVFHRVRIGPGKGICMGRIGSTLVFNLPGGPPSNHVALVTLALPGISRLMGSVAPFPLQQEVVLTRAIQGQADWTQFVYCTAFLDQGMIRACPLSAGSRLEIMAASHVLVEIPEGCSRIGKGERGTARVFRPAYLNGPARG